VENEGEISKAKFTDKQVIAESIKRRLVCVQKPHMTRPQNTYFTQLLWGKPTRRRPTVRANFAYR